MRAQLGTIKGQRIDKNRDAEDDSRLLDCELSSIEDVQTVELMVPSGEDFSPQNEDVVLIIQISDAYKLGILVDDQVAPDESNLSGEKEIYSKDGSTKLARLKLNKDGQVILNQGTDFAVLYNELKTQIDKLKSDLLAHVHPGVTAGGASTGVSITVFDVNVDNAKAEKVRI